MQPLPEQTYLRNAVSVSLIVPMLNEVKNVDGLLAAIFAEGGHDL